MIRFFQNKNLSGNPKEIISFDFLAGENVTASLSSDVIGTVNDSTIDMLVPAGTDITRLIPDIAYNGESISPDDFVEQDFTNPVVYTVTRFDSTTKQYTVTVQVPTLSIDDVSVSENAGTAQFTVTLSPAWGQTVTVDYATSDISASDGNDYTGIGITTLTFDPGETEKTIDVTILDDTADEDDESYNINLSNASNAEISGPSGQGTISDDDDPPDISFDLSTSSTGDETAILRSFDVVLSEASGKTITVVVTDDESGSAVSGTDYNLTNSSPETLTFNPGDTTKSVTFTPIVDTIDEDSGETIIFNLSDESNANLAAPTGHTATITDDDGTPVVNFASASGNDEESVTSFDIPVQLSNATILPVEVEYTVTAGTAEDGGTDFTLANGSVTITALSTSANINFTVNNDLLDEDNEDFQVTLDSVSSGNATLGGTSTYTYTINDDDDPPSLSISDVSVAENEGPAQFTVSLSAESGKTVTVNYESADVTAVAGSDYTAVSSTLTFNPGVTSQTIDVTILDESSDENDETYNINLSGQLNASIGTGTGIGTITNDDSDPSLSINDVSVSESDGTAQFTVSLSEASGKTVTVNYATSNGTASAGSDYTGITSTLMTFDPGTTSQTIDVIILSDMDSETDETFYVSLSGELNATISDDMGVGTILDTLFCPDGYILVPANSEVGVPYDFCVMKYEAKCWDDANSDEIVTSDEVVACTGAQAGYKPGSHEDAAPWNSITIDDAAAECSSLNTEGTGGVDTNNDGTYGIISNPEWMAIARNVENVDSNWTGGTMGSGCLKRGNAAATDTCSGGSSTYNNGAVDYGTGRNPLASLTLSNDEVIWDLSSNMLEFVDLFPGDPIDYIDDPNNQVPYDSSIGNLLYDVINMLEDIDTYSSSILDVSIQRDHMNHTSYTHGLGYVRKKNTLNNCIIRGGASHNNPYDIGVYRWWSANFGANASIGFRCVYRPPSVTSDTTAPTAPSNVSPLTSETAASYIPTWTDGADANLDHHRIIACKTSDCTAHCSKTVTPAISGVSEYPIPMTGDAYYMCVQAVDKSGNVSSWAASTNTVTYRGISSFVLKSADNPSLGSDMPGTIEGSNISIIVPNGMNITSIKPDIIHDGISVSPVSGDPVDFSAGPVLYTVNYADSSTEVFTVTIDNAQSVIVADITTAATPTTMHPIFSITISFDQDITAFYSESLIVKNGEVISLNTVTANREYTAEILSFEPSQSVTVTIPSGRVYDLATSTIYNTASQVSTLYDGTEINILTNASMETGDWTGWSYTDKGSGWAFLDTTFTAPGATDGYILMSSYTYDDWCYRHQTNIDLLTKGLSEEQLDSLPDIYAGAWIRERDEDGSHAPDWYQIKVTLMDESFGVIDTWDTGQAQTPGNADGDPMKWGLIHHTFSGYGTPVRYITYENWGKDTEGWAGQFGTQFDEAFVNILNVP